MLETHFLLPVTLEITLVGGEDMLLKWLLSGFGFHSQTKVLPLLVFLFFLCAMALCTVFVLQLDKSMHGHIPSSM